MESLAAHLSLILLALAASLKLPLLGKKHHSNLKLQQLSYFFLFLASLSISVWFFSSWASPLFEARSAYELGFVLAMAWFGVLTLPMIQTHVYQVLIAPLLLLLVFVHIVLDGFRIRYDSFAHSYLKCHISCAVVGQVLAVVAAILALCYLGQYRLLKEKRFLRMTSRFPALDTFDDLLITTLGAGFLFLSIAIFSGAYYLAQNSAELGSLLLVKLLWAIAVWVWYFAAVCARMLLHVSTKKMAQMSLWGFAFLVITYFGLIF